MDYIIHILILISIFGILGVSLNMVVGYTGLLSVAHAAFFGIGAYTTAILMTVVNMNFFLATLLGVIVTMVGALLIGAVLSKFRDDYYALASFGFNIIVLAIFLNWQDVTRGPLGIPGIDRPVIGNFVFSENIWFLVLTIAMTVLVYVIAQGLGKSSFGRTLKAIREDEKAIAVFGYNTLVYKLVIFVIGAGMAAIAGGIFASYISFIDPSSFVLMESIYILAIIIIGGLANNRGALVGAVIIILLPELLRFVGFSPAIAAQMRQVIFGLLLVFLMLYRPQGLFGEYKL